MDPGGFVRRRLILGFGLLVLPVLAAAQGRGAVFMGRVLTDSTHLPLANAEVSIPQLGLHGVTNDNGQFRLEDIIAGKHQILVRRLGYGVLDTRLDFVENQTVESTVYLSRITILDSVLVGGRQRDPWLAEFDENRAHGSGHYITRAELDRQNGRTLAAIMAQMPGLDVMYGSGGQGWAKGRRAPNSRCDTRDVQCLRREGLFYVPQRYEVAEGMKRACYARVYIDRMLMNPGQPAGPFDLNIIQAMEIEAVEWYATSAETPAKYNSRTSSCGVMVIHTRRGL